ncbi:DUF2625 domain-containing protein [Paraflavitalea soli]|nr:DUF2625 domain-containing protein [Paraflavitalea soli]
MRSRFLFIALLIATLTGAAQNKMRPLEALIDKNDPGWPLIRSWIDTAKNKVEVLPADPSKAGDALFNTQVTTQSPMGAVVYMTGGLLIDHGWIRILGSGNARLTRSLPEWNKGKSFQEYGEAPGYWLIADDVLGGFFAVNTGTFSREKIGNVYYLAPDNLEWEDLNMTYAGFLHFCLNGNLDKYYEGFRWKDWQKEVAKLPGDKVYMFFPFLWSKDWKDINKVTREEAPADQQFKFNMETRKRLGLETNYHK